MTTVVASDLDRTLIYSSAALLLNTSDSTDPQLNCVEVYNGKPLSFMMHTAMLRLQALQQRVPVVPTTTRTVAQYQRINLRIAVPEYAITSNGGNILHRGIVDAQWNADIHQQLASMSVPLAELEIELARRTDPSWVLTSQTADNLFSYLVVDSARMPVDFLEQWRQWCLERGWVVSMQGRKIYSIPTFISKSHAINEVLRRLGGSRLLSAGDGLLDADLLETADLAIRPQHGELEALQFFCPGLTVTSATGVAAGQEIVQWFCDQSN
ncbi:MAG: HAD family hydrolase [Mycobacteriaceae bacterium]